ARLALSIIRHSSKLAKQHAQVYVDHPPGILYGPRTTGHRKREEEPPLARALGHLIPAHRLSALVAPPHAAMRLGDQAKVDRTGVAILKPPPAAPDRAALAHRRVKPPRVLALLVAHDQAVNARPLAQIHPATPVRMG